MLRCSQAVHRTALQAEPPPPAVQQTALQPQCLPLAVQQMVLQVVHLKRCVNAEHNQSTGHRSRLCGQMRCARQCVCLRGCQASLETGAMACCASRSVQWCLCCCAPGGSLSTQLSDGPLTRESWAHEFQEELLNAGNMQSLMQWPCCALAWPNQNLSKSQIHGHAKLKCLDTFTLASTSDKSPPYRMILLARMLSSMTVPGTQVFL